MTVKIFVTGGTFDKEYNELNGELFFNGSHMQEVLKLGRCKVKCEVETLMMKDSTLITDEDRGLILDKCSNSDEKHIIITHGTDTMVKTAEVLSVVKDKTIVLTGAMIPYQFGASDALFNLGSALALVHSLPSGVYIAMNGRYFLWNNCRKNLEKGEFEEIHESKSLNLVG